MSAHFNRILLKIKREYSAHEIHGILIETIKKLEFENGVLKSDLSEINDLKKAQLEAKAEKINHLKEVKKQHTERIKQLEKEVDKLQSELRVYKRQVEKQTHIIAQQLKHLSNLKTIE